jgi:predicted Zn-dependent protease with MMP-like domain
MLGGMKSDLPPPSRRGIMTVRQFESIVDDVIASLPQWVVGRVDNLTVVVEDWPTTHQDPDGTGLLGIYEGVSLLQRGADYFASAPDVITVFRGPHLELGLGRGALNAEIRRTVLHEMAHHLGIDDTRLHELGFD